MICLGCLWYCKSTIFQANHNAILKQPFSKSDVCDTAKVRFFKQITTCVNAIIYNLPMFVILQKYDFSSKSQHEELGAIYSPWCLWYCKSTIFQANHNASNWRMPTSWMFVILQKYDFSSKSQLTLTAGQKCVRCLWYCKSTIFQANHNVLLLSLQSRTDVCDTAKVRFFKQITTKQRNELNKSGCLWYCKSTIFQANHNAAQGGNVGGHDVCDTAKVRFFKQITTPYV